MRKINCFEKIYKLNGIKIGDKITISSICKFIDFGKFEFNIKIFGNDPENPIFNNISSDILAGMAHKHNNTLIIPINESLIDAQLFCITYFSLSDFDLDSVVVQILD